jgi:hypothetical protein
MNRINLTNLSAVKAMSRNEMAAAQGGGFLDTLKTINRIRSLGCALVALRFPSVKKSKIFKVLCFAA